jgi:prepilin-type N-terminal cleavage/methylation domain-containing protein
MNKKGVTLIELIVVMVIIAIGAALMAPAIGRWLPNYRLRSATRDIASNMRTAQMKAVSQNMQYQVSFNSADTGGLNNNNSYVLQRNTGGISVNDGVVQALPNGITIASNNLQNQRAIFNPNSTSPSGGTITLTNTKSQKSIILSAATARARIQ